MNDILHANIFFFITSIAVIVIAILAAIGLYYVICILRSARNIAEKAERGTEALSQDLDELRHNIRKEGARFKHFKKFFSGVRAGHDKR